MAVRTRRQALPATPFPGLDATDPIRSSLSAFTDGVAFGVLLVALAATPVAFSIANEDVFAMPKSLIAAALGALLVVVLGIRWLLQGGPAGPVRISWPGMVLAGFLVWNILAWMVAIDREYAIVGAHVQYQGLGILLAYGGAMVAAWTTVRSPHRRRLLLVSVLIAATVAALYAVIQRLGMDPIWDGYLPDGRVFSTIGQSNALAAYFVMSIPLTVAVGAGRNFPWQVAMGLLTVLQVAALAFTLSRGGFLGAAVAVLALAGAIVLRWGRIVSGRALLITGALGIAVVTATATIPSGPSTAVQVARRAAATVDFEDGSIRMHLDQWAVGSAIALDHPIVGTGQDTYALLFDEYHRSVLSPDRIRAWTHRRAESPHNHYLAIAGGAGIPALGAYLALIGIVGARSLATIRRAPDSTTIVVGAGILAAICGHLVTDAFMTAETSGSLLFWALLGTGAALGSGQSEATRTTPPRRSATTGAS